MRKYIIFTAVIALIAIFLNSRHYIKQIEQYKKDYLEAMANNKAYESQLSDNKEQSVVFNNTISELENSNDSLLQVLLDVKKERKIKDKNTTAVAYQVSTVYKTDTLNLKDTIFISPDICIDTIIGDKWYSNNIKLCYPSTITVSPMFYSERYLIVNTKKEYVKPKSKWFFIRWFQKKQTIVEVDVEEKNPYIDINKQKFIKIVK